MSRRRNVDARLLDKVITIQRKVETQSVNGELVPSWVKVVDTRASVVARRATQERPGVGGIVAGIEHTFDIRADVYERFGIRLVDRILWRGDPYNIAAAEDNQLDGRLTTLVAVTGLNEG